jgi:hypothetical protein
MPEYDHAMTACLLVLTYLSFIIIFPIISKRYGVIFAVKTPTLNSLKVSQTKEPDSFGTEVRG